MATFEQLAFGFDEEPGASVTLPPPPPATRGLRPSPNEVPRQEGAAVPSGTRLAAGEPAHACGAASALPVPSSPASSSPAPLDHPQANREVLLAGQRVRFAFRRGKRRTIGFVVGPDGLSVSAPRWVGLGEVDAALQEKGAWILRKLQEQGERSRRLQSARIEWTDGALVPYLGRQIRLLLDAGGVSAPGGAVLDAETSTAPAVLRLGLPPDAQAERIRDVVHSWWQRQAKRLFEERCALYAQQLGVTVKKLGLSAAQTRWGSATADGSVRLNWRLIQFPMSTIDYVVVHELAHLREMNHSAAFWDVVRSVLPTFEVAQAPLKQSVPMGD